MTRKYLRSFATLTAIVGAATCIANAPADAEPGEVDGGGMHVVASVDVSNSVPAGANTVTGIPFVHAAKVSGNYSVSVDGASSVRSGEIAIGYLVGCAVDVSEGVTIGIAPSVGVSAGIAPSLALTLGESPSVTVAISPNVGVNAGLAGAISITLVPGNVTAVVIGAASLDQDATFPYTFSHTNTPLNISGCMSPASAMPFVTVRADNTSGTAQTTGYGTEFAF
ncbi:MspA family porin [Nocardia anaemiae]|uniref:MspA family porin n=1 Tax=Nocardia anaemiae TaxID=263910 RepID=UPI0007A41AB7|nr:MspA family porin [Nocardia anaemiae]